MVSSRVSFSFTYYQFICGSYSSIAQRRRYLFCLYARYFYYSLNINIYWETAEHIYRIQAHTHGFYWFILNLLPQFTEAHKAKKFAYMYLCSCNVYTIYFCRFSELLNCSLKHTRTLCLLRSPQQRASWYLVLWIHDILWLNFRTSHWIFIYTNTTNELFSKEKYRFFRRM